MTVSELIGLAENLGFAITGNETEMLDSIHREVSGMHRWSWREATGTVPATVNNNVLDVSALTTLEKPDRVSLEFGTGDLEQLDYLRPREFRELEHEDRDVDKPMYWTWWGRTIRLWPRPDKAYTVRIDYIRLPTVLNDSADVPDLPLVHHDILAWGLISQLALRQRDHQFADRAQQTYQRKLDIMIRDEGIQQRTGPSTVVDSGFYDSLSPADFYYD